MLHLLCKIYEIIKFLARQRLTGFEPPARPHLESAGFEIFLSSLYSCNFYLEYGSGGSTVIASEKRIPLIVSVESDHFYSRAVSRVVSSSVLTLNPRIGITGPWGFPLFKHKSAARLARWRRYVDAPYAHAAFSTGLPNLVLIDGRFRCACFLRLAREVIERDACVRVLFDDYYDCGRPYYATVEEAGVVPTRHGRMALFELRACLLKQRRVDALLQEAYEDCR